MIQNVTRFRALGLSMMAIIALCPALASAQTAFVHRTTAKNVTGHIAFLEHPAVQGDASLVLLVTPRVEGDATVNRPIGVYFADGRWAIFAEDRSPMPIGVSFNIEVFPFGPNAYVARPKASEIAGNTVVISHPSLDGNPFATPLVTQGWEAASGVYNPHQIGAWYNGRQWTVFNQDRAPMPANACFHVVVSPAVVVEAGPLHAVKGADSEESILQATALYGDSAVYCDRAFGLGFRDGRWSLASADVVSLPDKALFLVRDPGSMPSPSSYAEKSLRRDLDQTASATSKREMTPEIKGWDKAARRDMSRPEELIEARKKEELAKRVLDDARRASPSGDAQSEETSPPSQYVPLGPILVGVGRAAATPSGTCSPTAANSGCPPRAWCVPASGGGGWCSIQPGNSSPAFTIAQHAVTLTSPAEGDRPEAGAPLSLLWQTTSEMEAPGAITMAAVMDAVPQIDVATNQIGNPARIRWIWTSARRGASRLGDVRLQDGFAGVGADGGLGAAWPPGRGLDNGTYHWFVYSIRGGTVLASSPTRVLRVGSSCSTRALADTRCQYAAQCVTHVEWPELAGCAQIGAERTCYRRCASSLDCCGGEQVCDFVNSPDRDTPIGQRLGICR